MERIFVAIASYRDPECQWTLLDLFEKARNPERVFVGICWQFISPQDDVTISLGPRPSQVSNVYFDARDSIGPSWAKSQAHKLWQGEEYILNIDSHMRFSRGWDQSMIDMLHACDSTQPILSTYPAGYEPPNSCMFATPVMLATEFTEAGILRFHGIHQEMERPSRNPFISGCFFFSSAQFLLQVPYDPYLNFHGEEIAMSVRAWTSAWDVFAPNDCCIHHYYGRLECPKHWDDCSNWLELQKRTEARVNDLLGVSCSTDPAITVGLKGAYGLGGKRGVEEFEAFAGVSFRDRIIWHSSESI